MARILLNEPHAEVRELLERVIVRLGHEPMWVDAAVADPSTEADVLLLEPAVPGGLEFAAAVQRVRPETPIVFASIRPPEPESMSFHPAAYLLKPFALKDLERALAVAFAGASETLVLA